jgi:hypothetical protein
MSLIHAFWKDASLKRFPCPFPLGTFRFSMNLMTRAARRLPSVVRWTVAVAPWDESIKWRARFLFPGETGGNSCS